MPSRQPTSQQGVVLIVVMIMLVIIGLTSAAVMRNALEADLISANVRSETAAMEAAQAALAYCERKINDKNDPLLADALFVIHAAPAAGQAQQWSNIAHWRTAGAGGYYTPPNWSTASTASESGKAVIAKPPQCMAENVTLTPRRVIQVTARGFTPDYSEDSSGAVTSGSTVWVQSTLSF